MMSNMANDASIQTMHTELIILLYFHHLNRSLFSAIVLKTTRFHCSAEKQL